MNPYIALSYLNAWYRWPELLRKIDAAMPAEDLGDRARTDGSYANVITLGLIPQFYLGGRQILLDMGMLKPTDAIDDVLYVLDFTRSPSTSPTTTPQEHTLPNLRQPQRLDPTPPARPGPSRRPRSVSRPATKLRTSPSARPWQQSPPTDSSAIASTV